MPIFQAAGIECHGWHAFNQGLANNLHRLGLDDKTIQAILKHSNVAVTQACYTKTVRADAEFRSHIVLNRQGKSSSIDSFDLG